MKTILVLAILILTFLFFRIVKLLSRQLSKANIYGQLIRRVEPVIELIIWTFIIFWSLDYLFSGHLYYPYLLIGLIIVITIAIGWFFLKDVIAGIIFRIQNDYSRGETVQFGDISGKVDAMFITHISIQTPEGKTMKIPYSALTNKVISQKPETKATEQHTFALETEKKRTAKDMEDEIKKALYNTPWRISNKIPVIRFLRETDRSYTFEILVYTRKEKHFIYIHETMEKKFGIKANLSL